MWVLITMFGIIKRLLKQKTGVRTKLLLPLFFVIWWCSQLMWHAHLLNSLRLHTLTLAIHVRCCTLETSAWTAVWASWWWGMETSWIITVVIFRNRNLCNIEIEEDIVTSSKVKTSRYNIFLCLFLEFNRF